MSEVYELPTFEKNRFETVAETFLNLETKLRAGEELTDDEQKWFEFVEEKLNDWKSS